MTLKPWSHVPDFNGLVLVLFPPEYTKKYKKMGYPGVNDHGSIMACGCGLPHGFPGFPGSTSLDPHRAIRDDAESYGDWGCLA